MRYLKVLFTVIIFYVVMLFFVQNQASFDEPVALTLDLLFMPPMQSIPLPVYAIMLMCFTLGGLLVLSMLIWDRLTISARCTSARSKSSSLEKKLQKSEVALKHTNDSAQKKEQALTEEIEKLKHELEELKNSSVIN